jgi:serine/threonine protein kinase
MEGRTISHYYVTDRLGTGGMGEVYKARDTQLDRLVALKFLPPELALNDHARSRLMREANAVSALDHPNICTIHGVETTSDGLLFLAMSFYDGETVKRRLARASMDVNEALEIAIQVTRGLATAHAAGIVHRDIKPANLMLTSDGVVKIVDFGIAAIAGQGGITTTGMRLGTLDYMSPEQINGAPLDHRTDIWSLGVTVYEMLASRPMFKGAHPLAIMDAIIGRDFVPLSALRPDLPAQLIQIVERATEHSRRRRYPSALEFGAALEACRAAMVAPTRFHNTFWRGLMGRG